MKKMCVEVPENLDIDKIIALNPQAFYGKGKLKPDSLLYVCGAIVKAHKRQYKQIGDEGTIYAEISSRKLDTVLHNYRAYTFFLWEEGIISRDYDFEVGEKCYGYCFNPPYRGQKLKTVEIKDHCLRKAIRRAGEEQKKRRKKTQKQVPYLTKWWDHPGLEIDKEAAFEWIDKYQSDRLNAIKIGSELEDRQFELDKCIDTCEIFRSHVRSIDEGNFSYGFSGRGQRFYTPISNLKKELRSFLTFKGQPLVELDKKNSQPYLSLALLNTSFWHCQKAEDGILSLGHILNKTVIKTRRGGMETG